LAVGQSEEGVAKTHTVAAWITQSGGAGDVIVALPAYRALRAHYPESRMVVLCGTAGLAAADLLGERDRTVVCHPFPGPTAFLADLARVVSVRADVLFCFSEVRSSTLLARFLRSPRKHGYDWEGRGRFFDTAVPFERNRANLKTLHLRLLREAEGIRARLEDTRLQAPAAAGQRAERLLEEFGVAPGAFVALHPGSHEAARRLPAGGMAAVVDHLAAAHGLPVVLVGGAAEREAAAALAAGRENVHAACGDVSWWETAALLERACCFVGNDSAPLHLADVLGVPAVGLFLPQHAVRHGPARPGSRIVIAGTEGHHPCPHADPAAPTAEHGDSTMADIRTADVLAAADDVLAGAGRAARSRP
jgi:heptosyltransferase-2/heptosyltransferase-3